MGSSATLIHGKVDSTTNNIPVKVDSSGVVATSATPSSSSSFAYSHAKTTALAASLEVKTSAGNLYGISGINTHTATLYIQVHDAAALPADTAVPILVLQVGPSSQFSLSLGDSGIPFTNGCFICNSTTLATKTISGATMWANATYK